MMDVGKRLDTLPPGSGRVLANGAAELAGLAELARRLQVLVGTHIQSRPPDAEGIYELQALDYLTQTLEDISRLIEAMTAPDAFESESVEALENVVKLRGLAQRLFNDAPVRDDGSGITIGEVALF